MSDRSRIEWTDATWNPVSGCTKITRGCDHCYAERIAERFRGVRITAGSERRKHHYYNGFDVTLHPHHLDRPLHWTRPRMIFVCSMSDLFHKDIPADYRDRVFDMMEQADWHTYQVLTKRSPRMRSYLKRRYSDTAPPGHIWFGVSVEDMDSLARVRHLVGTPAAVRFLSCEPLLGSLKDLDLAGIDWVIAGGESGPPARPMHPDWARELRDRCAAAGIPFFFKQWGEWAETGEAPDPRYPLTGFGEWAGRPCTMQKIGKKAAGRLLDGVAHDAWPLAARAAA